MVTKKVVVIGGGFGGLNVTTSLKQTSVDVFLIDKKNHHLFQPLLYEVATAAISPGDIATPLREILRNQSNAAVIMGEVIHIDKCAKKITLGDGENIDYDTLVIAIGARHSYFGKEAWEPFAPGLKTVNDAEQIRERILLSFERAERLKTFAGKDASLNFVIVGGGPTGVEMAGAIAEIAYKTMTKNFRYIDPSKAHIYLIEALPSILPMFPPRLARIATKTLEKMGVKVLTGKTVTDIHANGIHIEDVFIESENVIWAAGNQVSSLLKSLDTPLDRSGRAIVESDLSLPGHQEIFVIGDAARVDTKKGKTLPGVAPVAMQQGRYVANLIINDFSKENRPPFCYFDKGSLATIGKFKAIALFWKFQFSGFFAWLIWALVHVMFLIGFRNRVGVMLDWGAVIFTGRRGVRLITQPIDKEEKETQNSGF